MVTARSHERATVSLLARNYCVLGTPPLPPIPPVGDGQKMVFSGLEICRR